MLKRKKNTFLVTFDNIQDFTQRRVVPLRQLNLSLALNTQQVSSQKNSVIVMVLYVVFDLHEG